MLVGVHDVVLRGVTVLAAAPQAVWVDSAARVTLDGVTVTNSAGTGVQVKGGTSVTVTHSRLVGNARAGLMEMAQAVGTTLSASTVSGNGKDGQQYNGDGVGLNGTGGSVVDNTITDNGDGVGFEHGIYAGPTANGYLIARNEIGDNAGADVKAAGGPGVVADNRLTSSMFGLVISDNPAVVTCRVQPRPGPLPARDPDHDRHDRARVRSSGTTPCSRRVARPRAAMPRRSSSSARRSSRCATTSSRTRTPICSARRSCSTTQTLVGSFVADTNWYASPDPDQLRVAWNGARVTWAKWLHALGRGRGEHRLGAARLHGRGRRGIRQSGRCEGHPRSVSRTIWSARRCPPSRRPT